MQTEWQDAKNLVDAESLGASAQEKTEREHVVGDNEDYGSSGSAGASAATYEEACKKQERLLDNLAKDQVLAYDKLLPEPTAIEVCQVGSESVKCVDHPRARAAQCCHDRIDCRQPRRGGGESDAPAATG